MIIERKQNLITILCFHSFSTLYTLGVKVHWVLINLFLPLCGTSFPSLCTRFLICMGIEGVWLLANTLPYPVTCWLMAVQCFAGFYLYLHYCEVSSTLFLWNEKLRSNKYCTLERKRRNDWELAYLPCQFGIHSLNSLFKPILIFMSMNVIVWLKVFCSRGWWSYHLYTL